MHTLALTLLTVPAAGPLDVLPWDVHPRLVAGDVRVAPLIVLAPPPTVDQTGLMHEEMARTDLVMRRHRAQELAALPQALHAALPGVLYAALPEGWQGHFRDADLGQGAQRELERALSGQGDLPSALAQAAAQAGGDATLFIWVRSAEGQPLTSQSLVGELVVSNGIPVVVSRADEPFEVQVEMGMALVAADGELLFRSEDSFGGLLSPDVGVRELALGMSQEMVGGIAPLWLGETHHVALVEVEETEPSDE